jgi:sugar phosphate isomerase/epimerase
MTGDKFDRRNFLKAGGVSALGTQMALAGGAALAQESAPTTPPHEKGFPQLAIITRYSPQKLAFAAATEYQGVVITVDRFFNPKQSDSQIDQILTIAREANLRIISIECVGPNHLASDPAKRREAIADFIQHLEFAHRLGCKFVGTFSGGMAGVPMEDQAKALAEVFNVNYLPVCDKLDISMGWENYPCDANFATVPGAWEKIFDLVPSKRLGLEFDPSHLVRQYIDYVQAAWDFKERILSVHAKDTEIIQPVLQEVGIHGKGWWRYRIPGQGLIDWPKFINVLLQAHYRGGIAVEHEDPFWDEPPSNNSPEFPQARKDGFILASRFLRMFLPGRLSG